MRGVGWGVFVWIGRDPWDSELEFGLVGGFEGCGVLEGRKVCLWIDR